MKDMKKTKDKRLVFIEAILRYSDQSGNINPFFYKDEMLKRLDVCEMNFDIMQKQLGDRYCRIVDIFEERSRYAVDVIECLELRDQMLQTNTKERRYREGRIRIILLEALIATFLLIIGGSWIV